MQLELQTETNNTSPSLFDIKFEAMNSYGLMKAAIMPISQSVAWYTIVQPGFPFYNSVCGISAFYCAWAAYKRYLEGNTLELGHYSMGFLALAAFFESRMLTALGTVVVIANTAFVIRIVFPWSAQKTAKTLKGEETDLAIAWSYVFKVYLVSLIALYGTILYKLIQMQA
jgi:hypothetical protein